MFKCDFTNEGTFVCDVIEAQWMHWSDLYFDKLFLIYFTKDWNKFYFKSLFTLARILNVLGDRLELLPSVIFSVNDYFKMAPSIGSHFENIKSEYLQK